MNYVLENFFETRRKELNPLFFLQLHFFISPSSLLLRTFLAHLTERVILSPFLAIFSEDLKRSMPFPMDITIFLEIAQPAIHRLG